MNPPPPSVRSGMPTWVQENLPQYFKDRPATTEALWAALYSLFLGTWTILGTCYGLAVGQSAADSLPHFLHWLGANWFGLFLGYCFAGGTAGVRANQAASKVATKGP